MVGLYNDLASWWPVISPPSEYAEEAALYVDMIQAASNFPVREVLELGSGGGNNASHMKRAFDLTLVEPAEGMRELSRALNPECAHADGDMRYVRLGRTFDAVFVHDAVMYMVNEDDLRAALATVAAHLAPGGVALMDPDATSETFREATSTAAVRTQADGGRATSNGRCRQCPARPPSRRTTRFSCASRTGPCALSTTCTMRACFRARRGSGCFARPGSPRR